MHNQDEHIYIYIYICRDTCLKAIVSEKVRVTIQRLACILVTEGMLEIQIKLIYIYIYILCYIITKWGQSMVTACMSDILTQYIAMFVLGEVCCSAYCN